MSFKLQATMASGLCGDETKPRRFDLSMSRRTRRPAAEILTTSCHEQDHHQAMVQPEQQDPDGLLCLSDHLQSQQPELDDHQEHETSEHRSQHTTQEQQDKALQKQAEEECQDNSRRFSLLELIEDEAVAVDDDVKDASTGGTEENAAAAREVAEGAAAAGEPKRSDQVPGRRVIGIMRRYVKVRSIKPKRASPEKNATPVC